MERNWFWTTEVKKILEVNCRSWRWLVWLIITVGMNTVLATLETSGGSVIKRRKLNISLSTWPVFSFRSDFQQQLAPLYFMTQKLWVKFHKWKSYVRGYREDVMALFIPSSKNLNIIGNDFFQGDWKQISKHARNSNNSK